MLADLPLMSASGAAAALGVPQCHQSVTLEKTVVLMVAYVSAEAGTCLLPKMKEDGHLKQGGKGAPEENQRDRRAITHREVHPLLS